MDIKVDGSTCEGMLHDGYKVWEPGKCMYLILGK